MKIEVKRVQSKKDWDEFISFPWKIYSKTPNWVPPLRIAVKDLLDVKKNPFFKHAYMKMMLARNAQTGEVVGRIVGVIDENHNKYHEEKTAFFGFYEVIDDLDVTRALLKEVKSWAQEWGMTTLRGPMNPSTNHECGLLVEGYDQDPSVMMTYNPPYYLKHLEACGFVKSKDLYAYDITHDSRFSERLVAHAEKLKQKSDVVIRPIKVKDFDAEVARILEIYNDAWEKNWGFVPMNPEEFKHMAKDMKGILDPELLLVAEIRGEPVGFALTLPDVNQAIKKVKNGKLLPFGLVKLLWNLKGPGRKKTLNRCRILTLGIKQKYRTAGIGPLFYMEYLNRGPSLGYPTGEASWILEDNIPMTRAIEMMGGKRTKVYRILEQSIQQ